MPVRQPSQRGGNMIGKFPSLKMARMVVYESTIERDFLYLLDFERDVTRFEEQPVTIEYRCDGQVLRYTPDFAVARADDTCLVECKPLALVDTAENQRKFHAATVWCAERGWRFQVVTDRELRAGHYLENVRLLTRYARQRTDAQIVSRVYGYLDPGRARGRQTLTQVARAIEPEKPHPVLSTLLHLAFHHHIVIPLKEGPISANSPVTLPDSAATGAP